MIELEDMTDADWIWAENYNAFRDEEIKALLMAPAARRKGNPFEPQSANWYRWEQGMTEIRDMYAARGSYGIGKLDLLKGEAR